MEADPTLREGGATGANEDSKGESGATQAPASFFPVFSRGRPELTTVWRRVRFCFDTGSNLFGCRFAAPSLPVPAPLETTSLPPALWRAKHSQPTPHRRRHSSPTRQRGRGTLRVLLPTTPSPTRNSRPLEGRSSASDGVGTNPPPLEQYCTNDYMSRK